MLASSVLLLATCGMLGSIVDVALFYRLAGGG